MRVTIEEVSPANLGDIPPPCDSCLYWHGSTPSRLEALSHEERVQMKRRWLEHTLQTQGMAGKLLYVDNRPVGFTHYGPRERFEALEDYKTEDGRKVEVSGDALFLGCLYIPLQEHRGKGLGRMLLREIIRDAQHRGYAAVETFARRDSPNNPSGPLPLFLSEDFRAVDEGLPTYPLVRKDLG